MWFHLYNLLFIALYMKISFLISKYLFCAEACTHSFVAIETPVVYLSAFSIYFLDVIQKKHFWICFLSYIIEIMLFYKKTVWRKFRVAEKKKKYYVTKALLWGDFVSHIVCVF
jgi:hypothetical protein